MEAREEERIVFWQTRVEGGGNWGWKRCASVSSPPGGSRKSRDDVLRDVPVSSGTIDSSDLICSANHRRNSRHLHLRAVQVWRLVAASARTMDDRRSMDGLRGF
jgi:hypothetical protein